MSLKFAGFGSISPVASGGDAHVFDTTTAYAAGNLASFQTNLVEKASIDFEGTFSGHDGIFGGKITVVETLIESGLFVNERRGILESIWPRGSDTGESHLSSGAGSFSKTGPIGPL